MIEKENISVIITAGGIGKRMQSSLPKQFMTVHEKPILLHTLIAFHENLPGAQLVITLPENWLEYWNDLLKDLGTEIPHHVVSGGQERYHSVRAALDICQGEYILVHDGVRPMVNSELISRCIQALYDGADAVVPTTPPKESLREKMDEGTGHVDRSKILVVQTPQCFKASILRHAYTLPYDPSVFDDATLAEKAGYHVVTVAGDNNNIKITDSMDLKLAELLLK